MGNGLTRRLSPVVHSLRVTLPLVILLLAGCSDPWTARIEQARRSQSDQLAFSTRVIGDDDLPALAALPQLRELLIEQSRITDAGFKSLRRFEKLEHLRLRGARITDDALDALDDWPRLRLLNLPQADLTDAGVARICRRERLELLRLGSPRATDESLVAVAACPSLRFLHLIDVPITDAGLKHLEQAQQLTSLYLDGSRVTDEGIERLVTASPHLHVHIDQRHSDRDPNRHTH